MIYDPDDESLSIYILIITFTVSIWTCITGIVQLYTVNRVPAAPCFEICQFLKRPHKRKRGRLQNTERLFLHFTVCLNMHKCWNIILAALCFVVCKFEKDFAKKNQDYNIWSPLLCLYSVYIWTGKLYGVCWDIGFGQYYNYVAGTTWGWSDKMVK